jgi:two-component system, LytTR family, sensor kinase
MKRSVIILLHVAYWLLYLFLFAFIYFISHTLTSYSLVINKDLSIVLFFVGITGLISFYINYFWLAPGLLGKKKLSSYVLGEIIACIATGLLSTLLANLGFYNLVSIIPESKIQITLLAGFTLLAILNGMLGTIIRGFILWYSEIRVKDMLEKKSLKAELSLLKTRLGGLYYMKLNLIVFP